MSHRANQIVEAMQTIIAAYSGLSVNSANVHVHRTLTLGEESAELDAITINIGDDESVSEFGTDNTAFIDSILSVPIVAYAKDPDEITLRRALINLRRQIHKALMASPTLGISPEIVMGIRYGGARAPEIDTSADAPAGSLESLWRVHYRMNVTDPGDG